MNPALVLEKAKTASEIDAMINGFVTTIRNYVEGKGWNRYNTSPEIKLLGSLVSELESKKAQVAAIVTNVVMGGKS